MKTQINFESFNKIYKYIIIIITSFEYSIDKNENIVRLFSFDKSKLIEIF